MVAPNSPSEDAVAAAFADLADKPVTVSSPREDINRLRSKTSYPELPYVSQPGSHQFVSAAWIPETRDAEKVADLPDCPPISWYPIPVPDEWAVSEADRFGCCAYACWLTTARCRNQTSYEALLLGTHFLNDLELVSELHAT